MTRRLAPLLAAVLAVTSACAGTPTARPAPATARPSPSSSCPTHVVAGNDANGTTVCVALGSDLTLLLRGDGGWSSPQVSPGALGPAEPVPTPAGSVGWSFRAVAAGTADISASGKICPSGPGALRCHSVAGYRLHVEVR